MKQTLNIHGLEPGDWTRIRQRPSRWGKFWRLIRFALAR